MRKALVLLLALPLAGCFGQSGEQVEAEQHNACMYYGFRYGSPEYANCRMQTAQQQQSMDFQRRQNLARGISSLGDNKAPQIQPSPQPPAPVRCQSVRNATGVETVCQ